MRDLSILIPSRNEMFLNNTIQDILNNIEADTEVIAVLDGQWPIEPIPDNPRVILIHFSESIGQRAATNVAARISKAKYLMKLDAHCGMDKGFDVKLMNDMQDNWTQVPIMRNLHAFDWVCECGHIRYQGPTKPCEKCGKDMRREIRWIAKTNPQSTAFRYDTTLHFQYWQDWKKKQVGDLVETFSLQGSCFMCTREKYFELNLCDETWGSWGNQGTEVATKTWLSGGRVIVNKKTFYAHMFRTQGSDFGFPYPQSGRAVERARQHSREMFFNNKFEKQIYPFSWLLDKFKPIPDWHEESGKVVLQQVMEAGEKFYKDRDFLSSSWASKIFTTGRGIGGKSPEEQKDANQQKNNLEATRRLEETMISPQPISPVPAPAPALFYPVPTKGILFYTNNRLNMKLAALVRKQIAKSGLPVTCVSQKPVGFGTNLVFKGDGKSGQVNMYRQILMGLEHIKEDIVFLAESDVLYHPFHFQFTPAEPNKFYYNGNYWVLRLKDGFAVHYNAQWLSGLVSYREPLLVHMRERVEMIDREGYSTNMGHEPMTHKRIAWKTWYDYEVFNPGVANIDIVHSGNMTLKKWKLDDFRTKPKFWEESTNYTVPGWNLVEELKRIDKSA